MRRFTSMAALALLAALLLVSSASAAAPPTPTATFRLVSGLPGTMQAGQYYTVTVEVMSPTRFRSAMALPDDQFPGKGVVARGADRAGAGTSATLEITFTAKGSTAALPGGVDQVAVVAGARYAGGQTVSQRFDFAVAVP